jgi:hypothetical protein
MYVCVCVCVCVFRMYAHTRVAATPFVGILALDWILYVCMYVCMYVFTYPIYVHVYVCVYVSAFYPLTKPFLLLTGFFSLFVHSQFK